MEHRSTRVVIFRGFGIYRSQPFWYVRWRITFSKPTWNWLSTAATSGVVGWLSGGFTFRFPELDGALTDLLVSRRPPTKTRFLCADEEA